MMLNETDGRHDRLKEHREAVSSGVRGASLKGEKWKVEGEKGERRKVNW